MPSKPSRPEAPLPAAPTLPPWLLPLSGLGQLIYFKRKPAFTEVALELSRAGTIVIGVPDHPDGADQLARALGQAGKILASAPSAPPRQLDFAARPGAGHD